MKVLMIVPPLDHVGGVSGHFRGLKPYWSNNLHYFIRYGKSKYPILNLLVYPVNLIRLFFSILMFSPDKVLVNVSLTKGFESSMLYIHICKLFKKKYILFFHGWNEAYEDYLEDEKYFKLINDCNGIFVLAEVFKNTLIQKQISAPIYITTTKVSDELISEFDINQRNGQFRNLLFVSRIEENKGVFITLDIFKKLQKHKPNLKLTIVGDGSAMNTLKSRVESEKIENVHIKGKLFGQALADEFINADFFFLITLHKEGLPAALLEAMAFGIPVATRPVGGIADFFTEEMGILSESISPDFYYKVLLDLMNNSSALIKISKVNHNYAKKNFIASSVARNFEKLLKQL